MKKEVQHGLLKKLPIWNIFPIGWFASDLQPNEEVYRLPFDCFNSLMNAPLMNQDGVLINSNPAKKMALRDAYKSLGTFYFFGPDILSD